MQVYAGFFTCSLGLVASESPTMLLERRIIWPYPRCVESETLGEAPSDLCSKKLPGASNAAATWEPLFCPTSHPLSLWLPCCSHFLGPAILGGLRQTCTPKAWQWLPSYFHLAPHASSLRAHSCIPKAQKECGIPFNACAQAIWKSAGILSFPQDTFLDKWGIETGKYILLSSSLWIDSFEMKFVCFLREQVYEVIKMGSIKDINGMDLTEAENIKKRWQEYIEELYKKDFHDPDNHDRVITHLEPDILDCEVKWALGSITTNKASGGDGIPVELFQIPKDDAVKVFHSTCQQIWKTQQWPQDWKRSVFIPITKKGNAKECSNYRTIALISHNSKVMLKI